MNADIAVVEGLASATVRVVAFEDLQCSDSAAYQRVVDRDLLPVYGSSVAFEHRDFPLAKHAFARDAAIASRYFASVRPELGIEFRRECLATLVGSTPEQLTSLIRQFATAADLDSDRAIEALNSEAFAEMVDRDHREGMQRGVVRVPTVFVVDNGEERSRLVERFTLEEISDCIETIVRTGQRT